MKRKTILLVSVAAIALIMGVCMVGCAQNSAQTKDRSGQKIEASSISTTSTYEASQDGEHALLADAEAATYENVAVNKTGNADGEEADFYGDNAAIFATNGATLSISNAVISSNGKHANGTFSYGQGTTVNISHSVINTTGNCSGGLMTTGGGTTNATDVTAETTGDSSAAIRSDRGGGTVSVSGGYFTTSGKGSPVIYSTADITVSEAYLKSDSSQGVVIEGKNSVTLKDCQFIVSNTSQNSNKSDFYQAVMIYQSASGDSTIGKSSFEMDGGTLENQNGDVFFITNTACDITLNGASITNNDSNGAFLRAAAAGWGNTGNNGGKANLNAVAQKIEGNIEVDSISVLNLYLKEKSSFTGAINPSGQSGDVYVELDSSSTWTLTADSYVSGLTCSSGSINLNGHTLYVNGVAYSNADSTGSAFEVAVSDSGSSSKSSGSSGGSDGKESNKKESGTKPSEAPEKK